MSTPSYDKFSLRRPEKLQQTLEIIRAHRLPHTILVESESLSEARAYVESCATTILQAENLQTHPDFFTLEPEGKSLTIKIEDVRRLIDLAQKTANQAGPKVFAIYQANYLNKNAADALLKTLEEPPSDTTFFLTVTSKMLLLPTILSRCVLHYLTPEDSKLNTSDAFQPWFQKFSELLRICFFGQKIPNPLYLSNLQREAVAFFENREDPSELALQQDQFFQKMAKITIETLLYKIPAIEIQKIFESFQKIPFMLAMNCSFSLVVEYLLLKIYFSRDTKIA